MTEQNKKQKKWSLLYCPGDEGRDTAIRSLAKKTGCSEIMARLLYMRGYQTEQEIHAFFHQDHALFHDPFQLQDVSLAVERIALALQREEKIAIYGDYDVDGVTSVSLLYLYLSSLGANVDYYIPSRTKEGYGLSAPAIDTLHQRGVKLMITVDTGITAIEEVDYAKSLGIDTVVTDHHECRDILPQAVAVVNPHRIDDAYPFKELAGVGVIFKVICAFEMSRCRKEGISEIEGVRRVCKEYADLVAIGTIADVMPVVDENRLIVTLGLQQLESTKRPGLRALIDAASGTRNEGNKYPKKRKINSGFIGFTIAPRMNAAGRVSNASIAVELLLAERKDRAEALAQELCELNTLRQVEENRIAEQAYTKIEQTMDAEKDRVIVIDDDTWQQGIIGIVSSRITERYGLPSILISFDGNTNQTPLGTDIGKGSGRSIKGMNLVEALIDSEDLLVRFGGHELAAGLSIQRSNIDAFRRRINQYAAKCLDEDALCVCLDADCEVSMDELTMPLAQEIAEMEPFGVSNPVPNLVLKEARINRIIPLSGGKHTKLILEKDGREMTALCFGTASAQFGFEVMDCVDVLFQLSVNEFQNVTSLQMIVQDIHVSESFEKEYALQSKRYEEIRNGAGYTENENILPSREDIAIVFSALRREYRAGHTVFPIRRLLALLFAQGYDSISYIKLKFIIRIMQELQVCGVMEPENDCYVFEFYYQPSKTNVEKSSILRKLKSQLRK